MRNDLILRFLDTNGDGTGIKNANENYLDSPTKFFIKGPKYGYYLINRMIVNIIDPDRPGREKYNNKILNNGISIKHTCPKKTLLNLTDMPIKIYGHWHKYCYDVIVESGANITKPAGVPSYGYVSVRWTFGKSGKPISLRNNDELAVYFNDDFTSLVEHNFMVQGYHSMCNF